MSKRYLLDLNVLVALASDEHEFHQKAHDWFDPMTKQDMWALCPFTDAGFIRLAANPATRVGPGSIMRAADVLAEIRKVPGYQYWSIADSWIDLTDSFVDRIFGHQQVTDAYLLGLAIREGGVLATFDRALKYMAGPQFAQNLHLIE